MFGRASPYNYSVGIYLLVSLLLSSQPFFFFPPEDSVLTLEVLSIPGSIEKVLNATLLLVL